MAAVLVLSLSVLVYVYVGYPALLRLLVWLRGPRRVRQGEITPPLSLVISAYNEADVIRRKLENALSLVYPATVWRSSSSPTPRRWHRRDRRGVMRRVAFG